MAVLDPYAEASQRQQLVEVAGVPGYFATKTGGDATANVVKVYNGGKLKPSTLSAPAMLEDLVVSRPYVPLVHGPIAKRYAKATGRLRTTISVYDTDVDLGPIGQPTVYPNALLIKHARPDHDAASADAGVWTLTFAVDEEA